ncbi:MAG: hypothetical protein WKG01_33055 [Kofleriaceae bacterium]
MMKLHSLLLVLVVACGSKQTPAPIQNPGSEQPPGGVTDTRSEIDKRRETACTEVGQKVTACAVDDAHAELAAGRIKKEQHEAITAAGIQKKNTEEFVTKCNVPDMSSRQVRVLEVCVREEAACGPFLACLDHLNDKGVKTEK